MWTLIIKNEIDTQMAGVAQKSYKQKLTISLADFGRSEGLGKYWKWSRDDNICDHLI